MTPTNTAFRRVAALAFMCLLAACSKEAPTSSAPPASPAAAADTNNPLPGVIGAPSDITANHTPGSPADGATAVGGLTTHAEHGSSATGGGAPAPTGGDAAPGHAASSARP